MNCVTEHLHTVKNAAPAQDETSMLAVVTVTYYACVLHQPSELRHCMCSFEMYSTNRMLQENSHFAVNFF